MSEQTVAAQLGNTLFGSGVTGALEALGSAYELAFAKGLSQLSSPGVSQIVDRTGHVGVTREIANYKVSLAIADQLAARIATESDPRVQEILKVAAAEFQGFAHAAGSRIVQASAYSTPNTTVEEAVSEIFEASPDFVASLLEPTPGAFASADAIADAAAQLLAEGMSVQSIVEQLQTSGVGSASQSMTDLSLSLEAHLRDSGSAAWHTIAAQAGGSALLQTALFESGYVPGLEVNAAAPFWEDAALAERVRALLTSDRVDFAQVSEYLPAAQALGWLVGAIDSDFSTEELNVLIDAAAVSTDGAAGVEGLVEQLEALLLVSAAPQGEASELGFYRSVFATIHDVQAAYPEGLDLESLATQRASALAQTAARETEEGLAYRYALTELNGFAVIGADYERFNANGELDLYDQASGEGAFTAQYLADRPELLAAMLYANLNELAPDAQSGTTYVPGVQDVYLDRDAGLRVSAASGAPAGLVIFDGATDAPLLGGAGNDRLYGEQGNDQIDGGQGDDYVDGGAGADQLAGGAGRDVVMGGLGDDSLLGNSDGDLLDGGAGYDEYRIGNGDVVRDADGSGRIVFVGGSGGGGGEPPAGIVLLGGMQVGDTSFFASDDGEVVYRENEDASVDFWVEGRHAVVRPGAADLGPRARAADGSSGADLGGTEVPTVGRPGLGLPLTLVSGPRDLPFKAPFLAAVGTPAPRRDPLVLDLDGDGLEVLGAQAVTYFDHDANGFAELSGWVDADDGLLALDRNGDGRINHGGELFGDQTQLASGRTAASGAEALSEWDTTGAGGNADGRIDTADAVWSNLRVWRDRDSDGFADDGELLSMDQAGIASIGLDFETATAVESGNMRTRTGQFMRADGSRAAVGEYLLARDAAHTIAENAVAIDATAAALPEVRGAGNVYDLRQAMARAAELRDLVAQFGSEASVERRSELVDRILFRWAGADGVQPGSRGQAMDARQLATLEMFMGMAFSGALGGDPGSRRCNPAHAGLSRAVGAGLCQADGADAPRRVVWPPRLQLG